MFGGWGVGIRGGPTGHVVQPPCCAYRSCCCKCSCEIVDLEVGKKVVVSATSQWYNATHEVRPRPCGGPHRPTGGPMHGALPSHRERWRRQGPKDPGGEIDGAGAPRQRS